jgi:hypothetical protein
VAEKTRAWAGRPVLVSIAAVQVVAGLLPSAPAQAAPVQAAPVQAAPVQVGPTRAARASEPVADERAGSSASMSARYSRRYTFVECEGRPNSGRIARLVATGPGKVLITGSVTPCRWPKPRDAAAVGWYAAGIDNERGIAKYLPYGGGRAHLLHGVANIPAGTDRVCLASAPNQAHDCFRVTVPALRNGEPGVPVVGERIPVRDANLPIFFPNCGSCWP